MSLEVLPLERLCHHRSSMSTAFTAGQSLIDRGFIQWPAPSWDEPAIVALDNHICVAGVNFIRDLKLRRVTVEFAWCLGSHPFALATCLIALRKLLRAEPVVEIAFTSHPGNCEMDKLVAKLGLVPTSTSFIVQLMESRRNAESRA